MNRVNKNRSRAMRIAVFSFSLCCIGLIFTLEHSLASLVIQSGIDGGPPGKTAAIRPLKGQKIVLKVDEIQGARIRWYRIFPDLSKMYKNANFPWDPNPYQWIGFAQMDYFRKELPQFRDQWAIEPFEIGKGEGLLNKIRSWFHPSQFAPSGYYHEDVGSFWFQVEVEQEGRIRKSPGIEDSDARGLSPKVFRVSIRDGEGYLGYLTSFFNVPGLFGSTVYQSENYIGADCADVLMAAYSQWKVKPIEKNYNVRMLIERFPKVDEFDLLHGLPGKNVQWGKDVRPGDFIAVRYQGRKFYQHIGALFEDTNRNGILDGEDVVLHAGPVPLHASFLKEGNFDGHVLILRP